MLEPVPAQIDFILGHSIKHERVIRIWGMTQGKDVSAFNCSLLHGDSLLHES
jgi:hypothetical protein